MGTRHRCSFCSGTQLFHRPGQELGLLSQVVVEEATNLSFYIVASEKLQEGDGARGVWWGGGLNSPCTSQACTQPPRCAPCTHTAPEQVCACTDPSVC